MLIGGGAAADKGEYAEEGRCGMVSMVEVVRSALGTGIKTTPSAFASCG